MLTKRSQGEGLVPCYQSVILMSSSKETIAIAGAGDMAKYFVEELEKAGMYNIVVLSRADREWFSSRPSVSLHITDYTLPSVVSILTETRATHLFSFLHDNTSFFVDAHRTFLSACIESPTCHRFVPSDYGGDIDAHPNKPRFYIPTHGPVRLMCENQDKIEWTVVNHGWFMDYFVANKERTHFKVDAVKGSWPLNMWHGDWTALIPGTGNEAISWTSGRDVGKALVRLIQIEKGGWPRHTYVTGQTASWNSIVSLLEHLNPGKTFKVSYRSISEVEQDQIAHASDPFPPVELWRAFMDEWNYSGASTPPADKVEAQRQTLFKGLTWRTIRDFILQERRMDEEGSEGKI